LAGLLSLGATKDHEALIGFRELDVLPLTAFWLYVDLLARLLGLVL
jgi:hypothetical protein